jgi:ankyrin repeat protein
VSNDPKLPPHPDPDWYRKAAKKKLAAMRRHDPGAKLAAAQLSVAREHGFASWRKLIGEIGARQLAASSAELFAAVRRDDYDRVRSLLAVEPRLSNVRSPDGQTPLHVASEINNPDTIKILLAHGADPRSRYGSSMHDALSWAVTTEAFEAAEALVQGGLQPDLFCAAGLGHLEAVRSFFDAGGKLKRNASRTGSSRFASDGSRLPCPPETPREIVSDALYIACRTARVEVAADLLKRDVDVNFRAFLGGTPLHYAHFGRSREIVEMLLAAGADPTLRDAEYDCTPRAFGICVAASWGLFRHVVLALRADPTLARVHDGRGTPLHEAAREGREEIARLLLACGADPHALDPEGKTPLDRAIDAGHERLRAILEPIRS